VSLREFHPDDHTAWQRIAGDPRVAAHTPWPALVAPEAAAAWINESLRMAAVAPRRNFHLVIEQYGTDLVGCGTLDVLSIPHRQGEIGLYLRPEVARLLLELAFTRLGLHRVQATADPDNITARRVLEHVNMRHEGTLLDRYLVEQQWRDRDMYAITLPEWRGLPLRRVATASAVPEAGIVEGDGVFGGAAPVAAAAAAPIAVSAPDGPAVVPPQSPEAEPATVAPVLAAPAPAPMPEPTPPATVPSAPDLRSPRESGLTAGHNADSLLIPGPRTQMPAPGPAPTPAPAPVPTADQQPPLEGVVTLAHELDDTDTDQEIFGSL
jgi:RimJ/RimL family protein N-acetyltransferase